MKLPEISVDKKVTTAMLALILVVFGGLALSRLGLDFFPEMEFPTISVITAYPGAASEDIENTITRPLEQVVNSVSGVKKVTSQTSEGVSVLMVEFEWGTNLDFAAQDLRDQISLWEDFLPEPSDKPLVVKFDLSQIPVIFWGVTAKSMPPSDLRELIDEQVAQRLERIDGVASAQAFSTGVREILVDVDKNALESHNLSLDGISMALAMENINLPAGRIVERHAEYLFRTLGEFENLDDIRNTVVGVTQTGQPVYVKDIAEVRDTLKEARFYARVEHEEAVFMLVSKRSGANTVITVEEVKRQLEKIRESLPPDVMFYTAMDQADMIRMVINSTANNALVGGIMAIFFIFLFLRNWRPTLTIGLAIPLSIITTFIAFYFAGYTINMLTLGGLALGVGMLVDNAVVVIENIYRHIEEGKGRNEAAKAGASEVGMAITASTLTTIAVFFPMAFAQGVTGQMTRGLALAITFSLLASLFVALTIVPMVSSVLFRVRSNETAELINRGPRYFQKVRDLYQRLLDKSLRRRRWVLGGTLVLFLLSFVLIPFLGTEFMPSMDRGMLMMTVKMPVGTSLAETDRVVRMVEDLLEEDPDVDIITAQVGSQAEDNPSDAAGGMSAAGTHEASLWVSLVDETERDLTDLEILENLRKKLPELEGVKFESLDMSQMMMGGAASPVEIKVFGDDLDRLKQTAESIVEQIADVEGLRDVKHSLSEGKPEYHIAVNREQASRLGLMVSQVANGVQAASLGRVATRYREGDEEVDIRIRFQESYRDSLDDIRNIPIASPANTMVRLDQVAAITRDEGPIMITRENQARQVTVSANIAGRDLGSVVKDIQARIGDIESTLPSGYFLEFGGAYEDMQDAFLIMAGAFALAILLVYMIMASQFESLRHPFVIMFTIPLSLVGVVLALLIGGKTVSLAVLIGFIMLAGIAVNNGIVMVDYTNQLRKRGVETRDAVLKACSVRLRPVLITALTTILGMLPMALSASSGSEMRAPMAVTVIGGLIATTLLTLFVIPIIYTLVERVKIVKK